MFLKCNGNEWKELYLCNNNRMTRRLCNIGSISFYCIVVGLDYAKIAFSSYFFLLLQSDIKNISDANVRYFIVMLTRIVRIYAFDRKIFNIAFHLCGSNILRNFLQCHLKKKKKLLNRPPNNTL